MDFPTRNLYRTAIEELARGSGLDEIEVADRALAASRAETGGRAADPGWQLIADGRRDFERAIGFGRRRACGRDGWRNVSGSAGYVGVHRLRHGGVARPRGLGALAAGGGRRVAGALGAGGGLAGERGGDGAGQPGRGLELRRDDPARAGAEGRRAGRAAHAGRGADAADRRGRSARADRAARGALPVRRRRRPDLRAADRRARRGRGDRCRATTQLLAQGACGDRGVERAARARACGAAVPAAAPAAASSIRAKASGWGGSASAASCTS